jgi:large subunit ribosomal protein L22
MEVQALTRYARMSPKKVRDVTRVIQGRKVPDALNQLSVITRKSARLVTKTLKSAIANAENNNNLSADDLTVKLAVIENGPVLKRFKAAARGSAAPRRKKMAHIRIILTDGSDETEAAPAKAKTETAAATTAATKK